MANLKNRELEDDSNFAQEEENGKKISRVWEFSLFLLECCLSMIACDCRRRDGRNGLNLQCAMLLGEKAEAKRKEQGK